VSRLMGEPRRLTALWTSTACYRDSFVFLFIHERKSSRVGNNGREIVDLWLLWPLVAPRTTSISVTLKPARVLWVWGACYILIPGMATSCRWGVESGKHMHPGTFGHVLAYMSYRQTQWAVCSQAVLIRGILLVEQRIMWIMKYNKHLFLSRNQSSACIYYTRYITTCFGYREPSSGEHNIVH
jgi:hypothetical protein